MLRLAHHAGERSDPQLGGQVEDRAGGRGRRDAVALGDLVVRERETVEPKSHTWPRAVRDRDVDNRRRAGTDAPMRGGREVAQGGTLAARPDRC